MNVINEAGLSTLWKVCTDTFISFPFLNTPNKALSLDETFNPIWKDFPTIGTNGTNSGKKMALKIDESGNGFVESDSILFSYKGVKTGSLDDLNDIEDAKAGDVWTLRQPDSQDEGIEYVYVQKEKGYVWEYLGEKFVQQEVYWEKPSDAGDDWKGKLLRNPPKLALVATSGSYNDLSSKPCIKKPSNNANGEIALGTDDGEKIAIKAAVTITSGADILVSQAYVDEQDAKVVKQIPTTYVKTIKVNEGDVTTAASNVIITTTECIKIGDNTAEYKPSNGTITLPAYPEVPIKKVQVDGEDINTDNGVVSLTTPDIPIKSIKVGSTALTADSDKAVTIPETLQFATKDSDSGLTLEISDFITGTPIYTYEKTILIHNTSTDSAITVSLPTTTENCTVVPMTESLSVPAGKYCEVVGTYYHDKNILTINGGVQV